MFDPELLRSVFCKSQIDDKNRITLNKGTGIVPGDKLYIVLEEDHLKIMDEERYEKLIESETNTLTSDEEKEKVITYYRIVSRATTVDKQNRLLIPSMLAKTQELTDEAYIVTEDDYISVYTAEKLDNYLSLFSEEKQKVLKKIVKNGLD